MKTEQYKIIEKYLIKEFVNRLFPISKVVAPVYKGFGNYVFEEIKSEENVTFKYIPTILPPKKYLLPKKETILEFKKNQELIIQPVVEYENLILFGVHTCDIAGFKCLNKVMSDTP
ncbi:MAG: Ni/Fe hydrogenase subunit beta, partial [Thermodesulfovibrio sp.]|nr:Ni/Fe hydrogenase subunit beta [Thermodesulfovibrio sp.]